MRQYLKKEISSKSQKTINYNDLPAEGSKQEIDSPLYQVLGISFSAHGPGQRKLEN